MKTVQFICPKWSLSMPWVEGFKKVFGEDCEFRPEPNYGNYPRTVIYLWCDKVALYYINNVSPDNVQNIVFMRRYEFFLGDWIHIDWKKVDKLCFVNNVFKHEFEHFYGSNGKVPVKTELVYNYVDLEKFKYKERNKYGNKIAMVGYINPKKGFPLALQIMNNLEGYDLHVAGTLQNAELYYYINYLASKLKIRVIFEGQIPYEDLDKWLDDKSFLLNCSISEGNPNSVNEAMAKGIKPVVHRWPGAIPQYGEDNTFDTVEKAVMNIRFGNYDSASYKKMVEEKFSIKNLEKVREWVKK